MNRHATYLLELSYLEPDEHLGYSYFDAIHGRIENYKR